MSLALYLSSPWWIKNMTSDALIAWLSIWTKVLYRTLLKMRWWILFYTFIMTLQYHTFSAIKCCLFVSISYLEAILYFEHNASWKRGWTLNMKKDTVGGICVKSLSDSGIWSCLAYLTEAHYTRKKTMRNVAFENLLLENDSARACTQACKSRTNRDVHFIKVS